MASPVARWRNEHVRFAWLLDELERHLDRFHVGARPDYAMMLEVMRYMTRYADACHHPREDLAFLIAAKRESRVCRTVQELLDEHAAITQSGDDLVRLLEAVLGDALLARRDVEEPGRAYVRALRTHMRREESLFPAVGRLLAAGDWAAIDRATPQIPDPLILAVAGDGFDGLRRRFRPRSNPTVRLVAHGGRFQ
jgi:hemerythrin-like domain-containing protein